MSIDLTSKCRTCLSASKTYYQLLDDVGENCQILKMLDCVVPEINISSPSQFSTLVCQKCVEKLLIGYKFQQLCLKSNKTLRNLLGIAMAETIQKFEKHVDPLTKETGRNKLKGDTCIQNVLNEEKKSGNDRLSDSYGEVDPCTSIRQTRSILDDVKLQDSVKEVEAIEHDFHCHYCLKSFEKKTSLSAHYNVHKKKVLFKNKIENLVSNFQDAQDLTKISKTITKEEINNELQIHDESTKDNLNNKRTITLGSPEMKDFDFIETDFANIEQHASKYVFDCKICGKVFDRSCNLQRHNSVHSLVRPYECEICKYRFGNPKIFKAHLFQHKSEGGQNIAQHLPDGYKCEVCQRNFMSMKQLTKHFKNQHPEVDKHKCDYCSRTFILQDSLLKHTDHRHKSDKNLLCEVCTKVFESAYRLKQHMLVHNSYLCPHCGKTFRGASNLRQHMERHTGLQKYQCRECPKRFNCKSDVIKHASAHSNAKPYVCDICGSRFTRKYSMQKHKSLHTAERSYKCDQCNMTFKLISLLKRHNRTHTGEKPYKCKYCERAYSESGDLTKHLRTHVGENTYMCDQCPMAFKYQTELRQHQSQHYKMNQKLPQKTKETSGEKH